MKTVLKLLNLVYFILAGVAIACYTANFIKPEWFPFLKMGVSADLTEENSKDVIKDELLEKFNITRADLFSEGNIKVEAEVRVSNEMLFNAWKAEGDGSAYVDDVFINPSIDSVVKQIEPTFKKVAEKAAKSSIKSQIEGMSNGTFYSDLLSSGHPELNSESLSSDVDSIYDALTADDATLDSVNAVYHDVYNTYSEALGNGSKTEEETKEELKEILEKYDLVDEDGNIKNIDEAIAALLADMLNGDKENEDEEPASVTLRKMLNPYYEGEGEGEEESPIAEELKKFIADKLVSKDVALGFKIAGICWAVFVLAWAIKLLQCIFCLFRKTPYVRTEPIGILAGLVQVILAFVSGLLLLAFKFGFITTLVRLPFIGQFISSVPFLGSTGIGLELTFSALIPGILVVVNFIYSIIYGFAKRSFKRSL